MSQQFVKISTYSLCFQHMFTLSEKKQVLFFFLTSHLPLCTIQVLFWLIVVHVELVMSKVLGQHCSYVKHNTTTLILFLVLQYMSSPLHTLHHSYISTMSLKFDHINLHTCMIIVSQPPWFFTLSPPLFHYNWLFPLSK